MRKESLLFEKSKIMLKISDFPVNSSSPSAAILYSNSNPIVIAVHNFDNFAKVNTNGMMLLKYIFEQHFSNVVTSYIYLDQQAIEEKLFGKRTKSSNAYVYRAILSLLEAEILHRSVTKNYYWFNLSIVTKYNYAA